VRLEVLAGVQTTIQKGGPAAGASPTASDFRHLSNLIFRLERVANARQASDHCGGKPHPLLCFRKCLHL